VISILAEPPVTLVDKVADKHGTLKVAQPTSSICSERGMTCRAQFLPADGSKGAAK